MAVQFYKISSTGDLYSLDKATGQVAKIQSLPAGAPVLVWGGAGLPYDLQSALNQGAPGYYPPTPSTFTPSTTPVTPGGTAYPMGQYSLVNITETAGIDPTMVFLVDNISKTYRPFASMEAFNSVYANNLDAAKRSIKEVHPADFSPGGMFGGYQQLDYNYAVQPDGNMKQFDASPSQLQTRYGQTINVPQEQNAAMGVDGFFNLLSKTDSGIDANFLNTLKNDRPTVAFYINAFAYGGYTLSDIYRDIKKKEVVKQGYLQNSNLMPISPSESRASYQNTDAGRTAYADPQTAPPQQIGRLDSNTMNLAIYDIPDEAFKTLVPILDYGSQEFKDAMSNIETAYYDVLMQQLSAATEQQKAIADYEWQQFKESAEDQLGVQLSNNALDAWKQIEAAYETFASRNLEGSGLQAETIDDYLNRVRANDKIQRLSSLSQQEVKEAAYYQKYATPTQVQQLITEDQAKGLPKEEWRATKWGLVPSDEIKNALSFSTLKAAHPNLSDEEINNYISSVLDEQGNYRGELYQKYVTKGLETQESKKTYQQIMAEQGALRKEEKAYKEFTTPETPFLRATTPSGAPSTTTPESSTAKNAPYKGSVNMYNQLQGAVTDYTPPPTPTPTVTPTPTSVVPPTPKTTSTVIPSKTPVLQPNYQLIGGQSVYKAPPVTTTPSQPINYTPLNYTPYIPPKTTTPTKTTMAPVSIGSFISKYSTAAPSTQPAKSQSGGLFSGIKNTWGKITSLF